jgi:hypothetical protein
VETSVKIKKTKFFVLGLLVFTIVFLKISEKHGFDILLRIQSGLFLKEYVVFGEDSIMTNVL